MWRFPIRMLSILSLPAADSARRSVHFSSPISTRGGADMIMYFGTPPRMYYTCLNSRSAHFIVMDAACGHSRETVECPRYCRDERLRRILCSPACEDLTPAVTIARCGTTSGFNVSESETFVDVGEDVTAMFHNSWPFYGRRGKERMRVELAKSGKTRPKTESRFEERPALVFDNVPFVRGFAFDKKYLHGRRAMMGLIPETHSGQPSFFSQLKSLGFVDRGQISLKQNIPPVYRSFTFPYASMLIGALDKYSCHNWRLFPASDRQSWAFEIRDVEFLGEKMRGQHFGRIALEYDRIGIPNSVVERFIAAGLLFELQVTRLILFKGDTRLLHLEFSVGSHRISIPTKWLIDTAFVRDAESRYTDGNQWSFGVMLLKWLCFGYDYDRGAVAWAERRQIRVQ